MKYFLLEYVTPSSDPEVRKNRKAKWDQSVSLYDIEFNKIKNTIPKDVLEVYQNAHDATIQTIEIRNKDEGMDIAIHMESYFYPEGFKGILMHCDVTSFFFTSCDHSDLSFYSKNRAYLYGELLLNQKHWTHNFLMYDGDTEVFIECKKLKWIKTH